ncbi:MAG: methyltransferase domain-containing protein [Proteobacteria bacterium]|nr:methyltransferase domain-containing protein [Pseudomonadota bacterium]
MPESLNSMLRCPNCKNSHLEGSASGQTSNCKDCGASFSIQDGVVDLLPGVKFDRSVSQFFMEFSPVVRIYESKWWRRSSVATFLLKISFDQECEAILKAAGLKGKGDLLDLACGPGIYTRPMARKLSRGRVIGLDISFPMLRQAAANAEKENLKNILFIRANAMELPFADSSFGCVNCTGALHLFPDARQVTREVARVLAPKGTFTISAVRRGPGKAGQVRAFFLDRIMGIRSFTPGDLESMLLPHEFSRFQVLHDQGLFMVMSAARG